MTNLVAREEKKCVGVASKLVHCGENALQVNIVVRTCWIRSIERIQRSVDIQRQVDASIGERVHALIVICIRRVIDRIYTDSVDS